VILASDTSSLVHATWGLVAATGLLVIAAAFPAISAIHERWTKAHSRAGHLIPDLHMLRSRFGGTVRELDEAGDPDAPWFDDMLASNDGDLELLEPLIDLAPSEGLEFTSELYVARHLLSQARYSIMTAESELESEVPDREAMTKALRRARNLYRASATTIDAAEHLIPHRRRTIRRRKSLKREAFLERFRRLGEEREERATQSFVGSDLD
jgi:hypothetical protein